MVSERSPVRPAAKVPGVAPFNADLGKSRNCRRLPLHRALRTLCALRLSSYFDSYVFALSLGIRAGCHRAEDRGSDAGRPLLFLRETLMKPRPKTGALTSVGTSPAVCGYPERPAGLGPRL